MTKRASSIDSEEGRKVETNTRSLQLLAFPDRPWGNACRIGAYSPATRRGKVDFEEYSISISTIHSSRYSLYCVILTVEAASWSSYT